MTTVKREPGYYWVKLNDADQQWQIAYFLPGGKWRVSGYFKNSQDFIFIDKPENRLTPPVMQQTVIINCYRKLTS
jgi:hypothetical protein